MLMTKIELEETKKDLEEGCMAGTFFKTGDKVIYRIFENGHRDISFWVSGRDLENEEIMTVSKDMFYIVFDLSMCNKVFNALVKRYKTC